MKTHLPKKFNKFIKITVIILMFFSIRTNFIAQEIVTPDLNVDKNVSLKRYYTDYEVEKIKDSNYSFLNEYVKVEGKKGLKVSANTEEEAIIIEEPINEVVAVGTAKLDSFQGELTGYGPDCKNCSGKVACSPYQNVKNGNIYYNDDNDYKDLRIVAADKIVPCGTIVKISGLKNVASEESIMAIVLDRGSAIKGNIIDLLFESEEEAFPIGRQKVEIDVIRWGLINK